MSTPSAPLPTLRPPRFRALRWLAEVGADLPEDARQRLLAIFYTSTAPLVIGALVTISFTGLAAWHLQNPILVGVAVVDALLLPLRLQALRSVGRPADLLFATGLAWAVLQGIAIATVVASGDATMIAISLATGLGAISGIVGRNFAAPRYAMAQVMIIDLAFKASFLVNHWEFTPLLAIQAVLFLLMNVGIIRQQRRTMIKAVLGDIDSRAQALTDPLTKLLNRRGLVAAFDAARERGDTPALFAVDLDGFKQVNDRFGHAAGDALIEQIADRLRDTCGPQHAICRLGGDEFLVLAPIAGRSAIQDFGTRLVLVLAAPYQLDEHSLARVGASVGAVSWNPSRPTLPAMMLLADRALYAAKTSGKGRCIVFEEDEGFLRAPALPHEARSSRAAG